MKHFKQIGLLLLPFLLLTVFLLSTDPYKIPLVFLVVPFVLLGFGTFRLTKTVLSILSPLSVTKVNLLAGMVTSFILVVAILQSIRQLSLADFLLLAALLGGLSFYLRRV